MKYLYIIIISFLMVGCSYHKKAERYEFKPLKKTKYLKKSKKKKNARATVLKKTVPPQPKPVEPIAPVVPPPEPIVPSSPLPLPAEEENNSSWWPW